MGEFTTKQALIVSAIRIFRQKGFQMTRVSDIVADAGVAQGTFYNYFKSKEAIFREICSGFIEKVQSKFLERSEHFFDGDTASEVIANVQQVVRDIFRIYQDNLDVAELLFREGIGNGGIFKEIYEGMFLLFMELIEEQMLKAVDRGLIHIEDVRIGSVFLFGLFERTLLYFMIIQKDTDLNQLERMVVDFVLKGLSFDYTFNAKTR